MSALEYQRALQRFQRQAFRYSGLDVARALFEAGRIEVEEFESQVMRALRGEPLVGITANRHRDGYYFYTDW